MCGVTILNSCYLRENLLILCGLPRPSMPDISIISGYTRYLAVDPYTSKYHDIWEAQISVLVTVIRLRFSPLVFSLRVFFSWVLVRLVPP